MSSTNDVAGINWSDERILPAFQIPSHLDVYDIRLLSRDVRLSVTTLVGLINRPQPRIYLLSRNDDLFWLQEAFASIPHTISPLTGNDIFMTLLTTYRDLVKGFIIYDPDFNDSINIATMMAGQRDGVIVSPAQAQQLLNSPQKLPILIDLRTLTYKWSSRLQAYQWAQQALLPGASTHLIAGLDPTFSTGIRSFLVATKAFIYWLDPRNILPDLRLGGLSEHYMMRKLFDAFPAGTAHVGWFINEGIGVILASLAAKPVFATDFSSNLEVWSSTPMMTQLPKQASESQEVARADAKVYVSFTMSEGDNLQYIQERMLHLWRDPARGSVPIGWAISPILPQAAPAMAEYYARTATPQDDLVAGPSGAGYMYPSFWPVAQYPAYLQRTGKLMQHMNLSLLEILDSNVLQNIPLTLRALFAGSGMALIDKDRQRRFVEGLATYGIQGLLSGGGQEKASWMLISDIPVYQNVGIAASVNQAVAMIRKAVSYSQQRPYFVNLYTLAWQMTPSDLVQVIEQLGSDYEAVTPYTLLMLLKQTQRGT